NSDVLPFVGNEPGYREQQRIATDSPPGSQRAGVASRIKEFRVGTECQRSDGWRVLEAEVAHHVPGKTLHPGRCRDDSARRSEDSAGGESFPSAAGDADLLAQQVAAIHVEKEGRSARPMRQQHSVSARPDVPTMDHIDVLGPGNPTSPPKLVGEDLR